MTIVAGTLKFGVDTHKTKSLAVTRGGQRGVLNFSNDAENIQTVEFEIPANVNGINNVDLLLQAYDYNYNSTIVVINEFKLHTDNVSGVYTMTSNTDTIPSLEHATSIGNQLLRILNTTDGVANTVPLLGNMTGLFIANDIISYATTMASNMVTLNNSVSGGISNISNSAMNLIISDVQTMNNYIYSTRTSDWAFYVQSIQILEDYNKLNKFDNMGNTQTYLVNNLIGTERLKDNLANQ
jgi:hypothetical protein